MSGNGCVNETYCSDHFTIYTYIKSLYCTPETNTVLYVNYISIQLGEKRKAVKEEQRKDKKDVGHIEKQKVKWQMYCC